MPTPQLLYDLAVRQQQAGRLRDAEGSLRELLHQQPAHADANRMLAVLAYQSGRAAEALHWIGRAIAFRPTDAELHDHQGVFLASCGRISEAVGAFRTAAALAPASAGIQYNLGNALKDHGELPEAIAAYQRSVTLKPDNAAVQNNLAAALQDHGRPTEAIAHYRNAVNLSGDDAHLRQRLAGALQLAGRVDEAIIEFRRAIGIAPSDASAYLNLGNALHTKGLFDEAMAVLHEALRLSPDLPAPHNSIANIHKETARLNEALGSYDRALAASQSLRHKLQHPPQRPAPGGPDPLKTEARIAGNRLFTMLLHPDYDGSRLCDEHRRWNDAYAQPLAPHVEAHENNANPHRKLRIGYVSADFRNHPAGYTLLGPLREHDHASFEIHCYCDVTVPDAITERFRRHADVWHATAQLSDADLSKRVRHDRIDVLIDLGLHSADNRLLVFARKPAPVQATFAGYPGTTGVQTIDYRLTDKHLDPPGMHDSHYTEESVRLPNSFWCYDPAATEPPINELPALSNGFVTFGCFNNFSKFNQRMLELWARVLQAAPGSKLRLLAGQGSHRAWAREILRAAGIEPGRVEFLQRRRRQPYLELYHSIDIGLDTLPWNGHVTSLDSFWMGVPVVTLVGDTAVGRAGLSLAVNVGLDELAAPDESGFVERAAALASDPPGLAQLRFTLRQRLQACPLMDAPSQARALEAAYRWMWHRWCGSREMGRQ